MSRRITVEQAREYFADKSQQEKAGVHPDQLPDDGFQYWALNGVCGVFHRMPWQGVWGSHYGVKREAWGSTVKPARAILTAFWDAEEPALIVGWTNADNRMAISFAKRLGFEEHGRMVLPNETVIMQGWSK